MNILCAYRYGIVGGVSTQFLLRQDVLRSAKVDCHLFFSEDNGLAALLGQRPAVSFGNRISLRRLVRELRPDVAVVVDSPELIAALQPRRRRPRLWLDVHTTTARGLAYLQDLPLRGLDGIMVPTRHGAGLVRQRLPGIEPQIVPNLIDPDFRPDESSAGGNSSQLPEFVWVGKLDTHKNWRMALVWGHWLQQALGPIRLVMVGGYTATDERVDELFRWADELDLGAALRWIDRIDNASLPALYRRMAQTGGAMLVTSRDESFGMAVAEALLCGCPVIANDLPVFREVFPDSPLMQRVDLWDPDSFLQAVAALPQEGRVEEARRLHRQLGRRYGPQSFLDAFKSVLGGSRQ